MQKPSIVVLLLIAFFLNCKTKTNKKITIQDNRRIEGYVNDKLLYDGVVRYYDAQTDQLLQESTFADGKLNGETRTYDLIGQITSEQMYESDKLNGWSSLFDSSGKIIYKNYYYYGLKVGAVQFFKSGVPADYYFYTFDNQLLLHLDYDSLHGKKINEIQPNLFYFQLRSYDLKESLSELPEESECFLYTLNPPQFDFKYSLISTDSSFNDQKIIKKIENETPFRVFTLPRTERGRLIALKLDIYDSINETSGHFFKKIR
ncbi:MAG: hypothetical protein KF746_27130 [Chitinophagaceae bacterium]|nr:hypothetical protein [Chitinophagaceae bacterium]